MQKFIEPGRLKYYEKMQKAYKYLKLAKKEYNEAVSMFAMSERKRATTCTEGNMTRLLKNTIVYYLNKHPYKNLEYHLKYKPCTATLIRDFPNLIEWNGFVKYYNFYFASEWYKINHEKVVKDYFNENN